MKEEEDQKLSTPEKELVNQPGAVGEEELPAGIEKTDKQEWEKTANAIRKDSLWKRITDWGTKSWGLR